MLIMPMASIITIVFEKFLNFFVHYIKMSFGNFDNARGVYSYNSFQKL